MSKLRSISTSIWSDPFFEDLESFEKLLFMYLITNEKTNMLGVYEVSIKKISFETGIEKKDVENCLYKLELQKKIKYINNYVVILNFLKHQNFNTNMKKSAIDTYNNLPSCLKDNDLTLTKDNPLESFETLSNHLVMVPKREVEVEVEYELEEETKVEVDSFAKNTIPSQINLIDSIQEIEKEKTTPAKKVNSFSEEVEDCYFNCLGFFENHLHPKNPNSWKDVIDKLNRIDNIPFEQIESVTKKTREDTFWKSNFLSLTKLRQKQKSSGLNYIVVFNEQIKSNNNNNPVKKEKVNAGLLLQQKYGLS